MTHTALKSASNQAGRKTAERRRAERYICGLGTSRHVIAKFTADGIGRKVIAQVRNISATGVSLVVNRPLDPERILNVELSRPSRSWFSAVPIRVVYSLPHPDGEYIIGGAFTRELTCDELRGLLGECQAV